MGLKGNLIGPFARGVKKRQRPVSVASHGLAVQKLFSAIANDHAVAVRVVAQIVRIA